MVGTAAASVGRSEAIIAASGSGCRNRSGMSSEAPTMNAAYGRPHDMAWNIGTIARTLSSTEMSMPSDMHTCIECR